MAERDHDILAAEYALGTLTSEERSEAERLLTSDPDFGRQVAQWQTLLSPLGEAVPPLRAPATLWPRIEKQIETARAGAPAGALSEPVLVQMEALRQRMAAWRTAAVGAAAAAAAIALMWFSGLQPPMPQQPPPARYVAMLQSDKGETGFVVSMALDDMRFVIRPVGAEAPQAKSYELWALMKSGKPPMTLGLVGTEAYAMMDAPSEIDPQELEKGVELAISLEPMGGAPQGQSMGPIVFAGELIRLMP